MPSQTTGTTPREPLADGATPGAVIRLDRSARFRAGVELRQLRDMALLSKEDFFLALRSACAVPFSPRMYDAWEAGTVAPPTSVRQQAEWLAFAHGSPVDPDWSRLLVEPQRDPGDRVDLESWAEDLERATGYVARQQFGWASALVDRWLTRVRRIQPDDEALHLRARSLVLLGDIQRDQGRLRGAWAAQRSYRQALRIFNELHLARREAQTELSLAVTSEMNHQLGFAARRYRALSVDERLTPRDRARAALWVGTALSKNGQHEPAVQAIARAARRFESLGEPDDLSVAHQKLALSYRSTGNLGRAFEHIARARELGGDVSPLQRVRLDTAHAHCLLSDGATRSAGFAALDRAEQLSAEYGLAHQLGSIGSIRAQFELAEDGV